MFNYAEYIDFCRLKISKNNKKNEKLVDSSIVKKSKKVGNNMAQKGGVSRSKKRCVF